MAEPLRIVIADDNYLVREGTRRLLEDSGLVVVQVALGSAAELLDAVRRGRPDAVLTDIRMPVSSAADQAAGPAMEGIDAAHCIKATTPGVGVVILSQYADESYAFELFRNGTAGLAYLLKDRVGDLQQLLSALREVATGGSVIDPQVVDALVTRRVRLRESPLARLRLGDASRTAPSGTKCPHASGGSSPHALAVHCRVGRLLAALGAAVIFGPLPFDMCSAQGDDPLLACPAPLRNGGWDAGDVDGISAAARWHCPRRVPPCSKA